MAQVQRGVPADIFIAISFTLTKMWKQSKCPTIGNVLNKIGYIHIRRF